MSHLRILQQAKEKNLPYVVIVEEDIQFTKPEWYNTKLAELLNKYPEYDVVLLAGNLRNPVMRVAENVLRVGKSWTTTGYIVQKHYYQTLIDNITTGIENLIREPDKHYLYAIDAYWMKLQAVGKWFIVYPRTVTQRPEYSDIEGERES
jgi:GR25 family glycosyltransferase involved in LPS biosynthesis